MIHGCLNFVRVLVEIFTSGVRSLAEKTSYLALKMGQANYIRFLNIMVYSRSYLARSVLFVASIVLFAFHKPLLK